MTKIYTGVVENIDDPLRADRVQVRVFGLHTDNKTLIPTESLPWAQLLHQVSSACVSGIGNSAHGLVNGTWVKLVFEDVDEQYPLIIGVVGGFSSSLSAGSTLEETAFMPVEEVLTKASEVAPIAQPVAVAGACESNVDISGFRSKYGSEGPNAVLTACCDAGISNPFAKIAILANVAKECEFKPRNESFKYSISRFREIFPSKASKLNDYQLAELLKSEEDTANFVYGGKYGNSDTEGYKYRGRGYIQITYKSNYQLASSDTGVDLISSPDQLNQVDISAKAAVKFVVRNVGLGALNGFTAQTEANQSVTRAIGGKSLSPTSGPGVEIFAKVEKYSALGTVTVMPEGAKEEVAPIGTANADGTVSDGLTKTARYAIAKSKVGFRDPTGKYPLDKFLNEPDTNRLSRRNTENTIFSEKKKKRRLDIQNVGGNWSQPSPPYNAKYPYNRGYFSESGHGLEFDDTEGQERVSMFHRSGTFSEIDSFGNRTNKIIGSDYTIIEKNGYVYIDGTVRITTGGSANITVLGNVNLAVDGSMTTDVGGDYTIKCGGDVKIHAGGVCRVASKGNFSVDSKYLEFNEKKMEVSVDARDATLTDHIEILGESIESSEMITNDDMTEKESTEFIATQVATGKITTDEIAQGKAAKATEADVAKPETEIKPIPGSCDAFLNRTDIPDSTMLSKHFSLGSLTTGVALPSERNKVRAHMGKSIGQIVCNLKQLAENTLDPIRDHYPNMIITNAFRLNTNGSQHNIGSAADTQYPGVAKKDYYEIAKWIKDNVLFDQLLLEYTSKGSVWIHVSYSQTPRKQVLTLMNHSTYGQGLHQLA